MKRSTWLQEFKLYNNSLIARFPSNSQIMKYEEPNVHLVDDQNYSTGGANNLASTHNVTYKTLYSCLKEVYLRCQFLKRRLSRAFCQTELVSVVDQVLVFGFLPVPLSSQLQHIWLGFLPEVVLDIDLNHLQATKCNYDQQEAGQSHNWQPSIANRPNLPTRFKIHSAKQLHKHFDRPKLGKTHDNVFFSCFCLWCLGIHLVS